MNNSRFWKRVKYQRNDLTVRTVGLAKRRQAELSITVSSEELVTEGEAFLRFVVDYLLTSGARITAGQTLNYGYWLVKFVTSADDLLEVWEYDTNGTGFIAGGTLALTYWRDQHRVCETYGAVFDPPNPEKLTVISEGVLEGDFLEGVRYPSPEHMSGWWLLGPKYNGDIKTLRIFHTYHVTHARPDLVRFLALPYGFRFDIRDTQRVWFDQEVASQPPAV